MAQHAPAPACFRCVSLEREIHRLRAQAVQLVDENDDLTSDNRSLRRAVKRLRLLLDAAEDRVAELEGDTQPEE